MAANNSFFSISEDDPVVNNGDGGGGSPATSNFSSVDLMQNVPSTSSPVARSRRLSSGSMTTEAANLFPIYESQIQAFQPILNADLDSTAGSEWEPEEDASSQRLTSISKEQLFQMLQKARGRYHKYKGRYSGTIFDKYFFYVK